jgi:hypothetical protein
MATNPAFDAFFKDAAARIAQNRKIGGGQSEYELAKLSTFKPGAFNEAKKAETDWNLGQGIIDTLSTGTYAVAGLGQRVGESFTKLGQGDLSNVVGDVVGNIPLSNFFGAEGGLFGAAGKGIQEKRTWSQNLTDAGVTDEGTAAAAGLALDIALDPTWLIGGGFIAAGAKGLNAGVKAASAATKAGVRLDKAGYEAIQATGKDVIPTATATQEGAGAVGKGWFQAAQGNALSGDAFNNLLQGIRQGNVESFAALKQKKIDDKAAKALRKEEKKIATQGQTLIGLQTPKIANEANLVEDAVKAGEETLTDVPTTQTDNIVPETASPEAAPAEQVKVAVEKTAKQPRKTKPAITKDVNAADEAIIAATDAPSIYKQSREALAPMKQGYMDANGIKALDTDFSAVKASDEAPDIAKAYDDMVSDPTNPAVISAYRALAAEVRAQYKYMTEQLGIKVSFIDGDPYNVVNPATGRLGPNSKLFMEDILNNKNLVVRDSTQDFLTDPHPLLSVEENNMFRAVHDFFGHAGSGRGVLQDGEEAAWISHSQMFSPEARRAMTTETRGQNSWRNTEGFGFDPTKLIDDESRYSFAPQKAALLPDRYTLTPAEKELLEGLNLKSNSFIGAVGARLFQLGDVLVEQLGRISSPTKSFIYSAEEIKALKPEVETRIFDYEGAHPVGSPAHKELNSLFKALTEHIAIPTERPYGSAFNTSMSILGKSTEQKITKEYLQTLKNEYPNLTQKELKAIAKEELSAAAGVEKATVEEVSKVKDLSVLGIISAAKGASSTYDNLGTTGVAAKKLQEVLDTPIDVTDLVETALRAEGRTAENIKPFAPTFWGIPKGERRWTSTMVDGERVGKIEPELYGKPNFASEDLIAMFPEDPLVLDRAKLRMAMGEVKPKNEATSIKNRIAQDRLWDAFRTRNAEVLPKVEEMERRSWQEGIVEGESEIFKRFINNEVVGLGKLPASLPTTAITTHTGTPMTTLGSLIENLYRVRQTRTDVGGGPFAVEQAAKLRAEVAKGGYKYKNVTIGGQVVRIQLGTYPELLQEYLLRKLLPAAETVAKKPIIPRIETVAAEMTDDTIKLVKQARNEALALDLFSNVKGIKSLGHARILADGGIEALTALARIKTNKYYIPGARVEQGTQRLDLIGVGSREQNKLEVIRDPATGAPTRDGKPVDLTKADTIEESFQNNLLNTEGTGWTGRAQNKSGSPYVEQSGQGSRELAILQAVRGSIKEISGAITAKELAASPEQAQLLKDVMATLGIDVKASAAPAAVFKQFQREARLKLEDVISGIEEAAKIESVNLQAYKIFTGGGKDFMTMIERVSMTETQQQVVKFTELAADQVDEYCRALSSAIELGDVLG